MYPIVLLIRSAFLLAVGLVCAHPAIAQNGIDTALVQLIDSLAAEDQRAMTVQPIDSAVATFQRIIRSNFPQVQAILGTHGFPGYDQVGEACSDHYWMLVQHSDFDVAFQKKALGLMQAEVERKNASGEKLAYLTDRIRLNEGQEQIYGTQVEMSEAGTHLKPCMDLAGLDARRASVGLPPIKDYLKKCDDLFFEQNKERLGRK